jgi:hypothetical protein
MKTNPLEDFIRANRDAFDNAEPPPALFAKISEQLPPASPSLPLRSFRFGLRHAAAAAALVVLAFAAGMGMATWQNQKMLAEVTRIQPDFAEAEQYYRIQISQRIRQLKATPGNHQPVLNDIRQLDQLMGELRRELAQAPAAAEEQIVANLIQTYKIKIDILEKVLDRRSAQPQPFNKINTHDTEL